MNIKKFKSKNLKKIILNVFLVLIGLFLGYILFGKSYALYEENKDFDAINGTVEETGDIYFAYYVDGTISRSMPNQNTGYTLDSSKSSCTNGVVPTWDYAAWNFVGNYTNYNATTTTRTKCVLYFNKTFKTVKTVLGNLEVNSYTPDFKKSACDDDTCESHEKGIYETTDYDGNPTYYYRGSVENNYVKFAGFYWRIIRINSNGSIRIIYDGTTAHENGEASTDRQYTTSNFNSARTDNMYVGYMYTEGDAHGIGTSSPVKTANDQFYAAKLISYASKLDTSVGFCGDRSTLSLQGGVGTGTVITYDKAYLRLIESTPTLKCENELDYYTVSSASVGNKALTYPIGLITVDDFLLAGHAGGVFDGNQNHMKTNPKSYIATGNAFWTMTPGGFYYPYGYSAYFPIVFLIGGTGFIHDASCQDTSGLRPVINIRSDVTVTGSGTKTDPYIIN